MVSAGHFKMSLTKNQWVLELSARIACALLTVALAGCSQDAAPEKAPAAVKTQTVELTDYAPRVELTGEIKAQSRATSRSV